ncbi:MAG TPA: MarR family transcriptional regulator [Sphingomicrobium sp.]|nr:MarR family transcriptional regulator [Sphingomicrobium sp.]
MRDLAGVSLNRDIARGSAASTAVVRAIITARKARREFFDSQLFADPAWDILLELYALECEQHRISVSKLSMNAGVPGTTGLRWVDRLESDGLVARSDDALDARRVWIRLSDKGSSAMRAFFERMSVALPAF